MICKPILFNTDMVRAILAGQKTQTRRVIKPQPTNPRWNNIGWLGWDDGHGYRMKSPYENGDVLWVRETWCKDASRYLYRANYGENEHFYQSGNEIAVPWHPSIHMPKQAARIFLRVKEVRVEFLQDIKADGISAEGITSIAATCGDMEIALVEWKNLWNSTIKRDDILAYGWDANPWVWVIEFERCEKPEGWN